MEFDYIFVLVTISLMGLAVGWDYEAVPNVPDELRFISRVVLTVIIAFTFTAVEGIPFLTTLLLSVIAIQAGEVAYYFTQSLWVRPQIVWSVELPIACNIAAIILTILVFAN